MVFTHNKTAKENADEHLLVSMTGLLATLTSTVKVRTDLLFKETAGCCSVTYILLGWLPMDSGLIWSCICSVYLFFLHIKDKPKRFF